MQLRELVQKLGVFSNNRLMLRAAAALVLVAGIAALVAVFRVAETSRWVTHTLEVRAAVFNLFIDLQDIETGARGYLLTGQDTFLKPYQNGDEEAGPAFNKLRMLASDNAAQQELLSELRPLLVEKREFLSQMIDLAREGKRDQAIERIREGRSNEVMNEIRTMIAQFEQRELDLLAERERLESRAHELLLVTMIRSLAGASALAFMALNGQKRLILQLQEESKKRERVEATLRQSQKMEAVGQLTGGVAHDFNNLLTIILGNLDTVRRRAASMSVDAAAPLIRPLDAALQSTKNAAKLTHRLLAFSRQQALDPVPLDLNKLIAGLSDLLARTSSPATIETVLSGGLWLTFADSNQMENALLNIVINAKDAMPEGGKITIETANSYLDEAYTAQFGDVRTGQYVMFSVTDTGTGIPPAIIERVFEPFFTTKEPGKGTGLGLSMIHGFVKQSGGHIRIYSEAGHGTTVKIYLPRLTQDSATATVPKAMDLDLQPLIRAKGSETILVVDDNEGVLEFTCSALEDLGYRVLIAKDGPEAVQIIESETAVDLLFTDVVMPNGMSGRQLADQAAEKRPRLPILFTTGYSRNAIVHQGRLDANVHLLSKPYTQKELAQKIRFLLDEAADKLASEGMEKKAFCSGLVSQGGWRLT